MSALSDLDLLQLDSVVLAPARDVLLHHRLVVNLPIRIRLSRQLTHLLVLLSFLFEGLDYFVLADGLADGCVLSCKKLVAVLKLQRLSVLPIKLLHHTVQLSPLLQILVILCCNIPHQLRHLGLDHDNLDLFHVLPLQLTSIIEPIQVLHRHYLLL